MTGTPPPFTSTPERMPLSSGGSTVLGATTPGDGESLVRRSGLIAGLLTLATIACLVLVGLVFTSSRSDPYTRSTLALSGSIDNGGRLFRINCAGCHGLAAQGLVGPNLHGVSHRRSDRSLIQQVISGRTPPMPRFQPDPQAMADLLAFLHSLPD
ncbi:MAG: cytochrome c [Synechococcaceae cyanobacterium]|nr:cytochrome c [Synechococcaceae cyanobacterium]